MSDQILKTKLFVPPTRMEQVPRQRLINRLIQGENGKLTLVSGPAGFGKTTLLSAWIAQTKLPIGWISLDGGDNDWNRFTQYLIQAFQKISAGFANELIELLYSAKPLNSEEFLPYFINQIAEIQTPFLIVLDDYHVITETKIHDLLLTILEYQPPQMHLVISTRADPPWPLARWRVRGELSEMRMENLRFTPEETFTFLNEIAGLGLSEQDIKQLDAKTEGWAAGLHLAAVSMQKRGDNSGFIQRFAGSNRFVFDYLMDEVFQELPQNIQDFLLETSVLDRLCAQLCDSVRADNDSQEILDHLEQMNLFVIPLDDQRCWYRYHPLFAELLRQISLQKIPEQISVLHHKAREWYQDNGLFSEAIQHAAAEGDIDLVSDMIENNLITVLEHRDLVWLLQWLDTLPPTVIKSRPWLSVAYAHMLLITGSTEDVIRHIQQAENSTANLPIQEQAHISSYIAFIQAELSSRSGNMAATIEYARSAMENLPPKDKRLHCSTASTLGTALQRCGFFEDAALAFETGISAGQTIGDSNAVISLYGDLIGLYVERGQLYQAHAACQESLHYIEKSYQKRGRYTPAASHIHFRLSTILRHWNDLEGSLTHAKNCNHILERWGVQRRLNLINLAIALHAIGKRTEAHQTLQEAEQVAKQDSAFWVDNVRATQVSFWLAEGKLEAAEHWVLEKEWKVDDGIDFQDQLLYRTLTQVRIVQGQHGDEDALSEAIGLLPHLLSMYESAGAIAYLIQTLILQALAFQIKGWQTQALISLKRAVSLGEKGGYIRVFVREGAPLEELLCSLADQWNRTPYIEKLLSAFDKTIKGGEQSGSALILDPLTDRELDVLRCLNSDFTISEIAEELVISVETVRTHIKRIYRKLDVHSRFEATTRAQKQHLL